MDEIHQLVHCDRGITSSVHSVNLQFAMNYVPSKSFHKEDIQRVAGHIFAFGVMLCAALRGETYTPKLRQVVSRADALKIEQANDCVMYCLDVVRW